MEIERIFGFIFAAVLGGILGSFANVLVIRWHEGKSLGGRSRCPSCKKTINPRHLVPVVSWLMLRGRCAYCRRKVHPQYVLVEAAAVVLGIIAAWRFDPFGQPQFWTEFLLSVGLLVPVAMDIRWKELPVQFMVFLGAAGALAGLFGFAAWLPGGWPAVGAIVYGVSAAVIFFGAQILVSRGRWLGEGDFWLGIALGLILGWPNVAVAVYTAYVLGGTYAAVGFALGRLTRKSKLPFAPALAAGTMVAMWYGPAVAKYFSYAFN
jgi:prepilin signal peptidase PulO-like enzyme (type II secretory pathway)